VTRNTKSLQNRLIALIAPFLPTAKQAFRAYRAFSAIFFATAIQPGIAPEKTNGDSLGSLSSSPSPERIDESVLKNRRLK
jgi:hypothetical protein